MSWKKALAYGLLVWIIMFAVVSAFIAIGISEFSYTWIITALVAGLLGVILGMATKPKNIGIGIMYALVWVVIGVILDALITRAFDPAILTQWTLWVGYAVFVVGVITGSLVRMSKKGPEEEFRGKPEDLSSEALGAKEEPPQTPPV